ncbi:alpha/beta-hydrolase [Trametes versicolor FP-101664 SS1]|uniref:alpha/beta-hydrolase n=1 Tax=Trametes versicolor (strain FP-101664) TaxID=717944 RepID=UPI0004621A1D|nr:alpha/beta-hydrolase [Trametes versicolor FP-101664 SS1]EIW57941.1 alpha/beta-hydrolase [Trametes versicolor FP-101664 SS1]
MAYRTTTVSPLLPSRRVQGGLRFVAKCYSPEKGNPDGVTALFFHCAGSHKEAWEPTIQYLFLQKDPGTGKPLLREAWAFDMQSHGEASSLNAAQLKKLSVGLPVDEYADGLKAFAITGALAGHRLVGVGHSLGTSAVILSTMADEVPSVRYEAIILIEPALITREVYNANLEEREGALKAMNKAISKRRDTWNTKEEARAYFEERFPWMMWDLRVRDLFVRYGLRQVSIPDASGKPVAKVTLACSSDHERCAYSQDEVYYTVVDRIQSLDPAVPIHYILGERADLIPEYIPQSVMGVRTPASVQKVPDAGHFVLQENPEGLGQAIAQVITGLPAVPVRAHL